MSHALLIVIGGFQVAFIIGVVWLLIMTDGRLRDRDRDSDVARLLLREPVAEFLVNRGGVETISRTLRRLPRVTAVREMERLGASILAPEQLCVVARSVRGDDWVVKTLADGDSRHWWKRLNAARLLPMVYAPQDRALFAKLVTDDNTAVAVAATAGIPAHADAALIHLLVQRLPAMPRTLRLRQMQALRDHSVIVSPIVVSALASDMSAGELIVMVELAEVIATPAGFYAIVNLADHPSADVRAAVARALRAAFVPGAPEAARRLLNDCDWHVRAAAARAVEGLRVTNAVPALSKALHDDEWWVRFRAAGALAALGEPGSIAIEEAVVSDDAFAREMAIAIGGLSPANLLDISG